MTINDFKILRNHQCSLQETSKDTAQTSIQFMTLCTKKVVNFDAVKTEFLNQLGESEEKAKSVDAFVMEEKNYLIEFKNGDAREQRQKIRNKATDSLMILNSIFDRQINDSRLSDIFVLVYNKNNVTLTEKEQIAAAKAKKGKRVFVLFGLEKLKGFCFLEVLTLNQEQFKEQIVDALGW